VSELKFGLVLEAVKQIQLTGNHYDDVQTPTFAARAKRVAATRYNITSFNNPANFLPEANSKL
jgi:hypothetical protein